METTLDQRPPPELSLRPPGKFEDPDFTADGDPRASVPLIEARTIWFNTGTLCNLACTHCYIESSPVNDRLSFIRLDEVTEYLDEINDLDWPVREIGFTGGEPFLNPEMVAMGEACLESGFEVLILTDAMRPMMRPAVQQGLRALGERFGSQLTLRVSLDHYSSELHDRERGVGSYDTALTGMRWLRGTGIKMTVAGRTRWNESESGLRQGYERLFADEDFEVDAWSPADLVLFPEMDVNAQVPEITTACWSILDKSPRDVMCSESRMVVKRKGAERPTVVACTLIPYDPQFELGSTLAESDQPVKLNHPHCAKFCVLGGGSCSV